MERPLTERPRVLAIGIALAGLTLGWVFLRALTGQTGTGRQPFLETVGVALSTPAALVFLTYLSGVFPFRRYYSERSVQRLFGDFFLSVIAAAAVGLFGTAVAGETIESPALLFLVGTALAFLGAFATFLSRTGSYLDWDAASAGE